MTDTDTDTDTEPKQKTEPKGTAALPAPAAPRPASAATTQGARVRPSNKPKRASKSQRKHVRRQKQAGQLKTPR